MLGSGWILPRADPAQRRRNGPGLRNRLRFRQHRRRNGELLIMGVTLCRAFEGLPRFLYSCDRHRSGSIYGHERGRELQARRLAFHCAATPLDVSFRSPSKFGAGVRWPLFCSRTCSGQLCDRTPGDLKPRRVGTGAVATDKVMPPCVNWSPGWPHKAARWLRRSRLENPVGNRSKTSHHSR